VSSGKSPDNQELRVIGVATGLGCSIVVALILCIGGGVLLDRQFGTSPVFTLLGVALGLVTAGYQLWELAKVGNTKTQAGPLTRQLSRLPMARASRPQGGPQAPALREHEE
jgi:F0F1-type ATP synthase assembly protein I